MLRLLDKENCVYKPPITQYFFLVVLDICITIRFLGRKNPQHAFLRRGSTAVDPMSQICGMQKILKFSGSRNLGKITGQFLAHISTFRCQDLSRRCGRTSIWRREWERLKAGESNGKLSPRTCPGCSMPEQYRSLDQALVPASRASKLNTNEINVLP